jgi:ubiquinone/menaquinone biosynthesis C-methylase UbiE
MKRRFPLVPLVYCISFGLLVSTATAQQATVDPDINARFRKPDVEKWIKRFERNDREVVRNLKAIVAACQLKPGMDVADIGAGTGVFTRPMAKIVGPEGKVYGVEISREFVDHLVKSSKEEGLENVVGVLGKDKQTTLEAASLDVAFICDTYHHFEHPAEMLADIHAALRPGGKMIIVDFRREEGKSSEWVLEHVRAGKETVIEEATEAGFRLVDEPVEMDTNYCVRFEKTAELSE